ncbi:MAG: AAA family ATPase [Chloroflexi bacterium]|nr:AAA family ATPase [Chloroflexota bacterium]
MTIPADRTSVTDDLDALLNVLPQSVAVAVRSLSDYSDLLEVVLDLGRAPEARFTGRELLLDLPPVTQIDIDQVLAGVGEIGGDNRAGIARTLHRISVIRNRGGRPIGLTCRVGRAVYGTITVIRDLIESGKSLLLLGKPGVGKTTMLREVARVLADDFRKRVIIVDTSNEIAGDGDIPHPGIGRSRRMQVPSPAQQHAVMIEAVENHMPEVIIIDEIGTELEAAAARTIAERGVQLIGTAHGNTLDNLMMNPTLSDLIGGIQTVTLGDEEARRRGTRKSVLERKAPPTFQIIVEIVDWRHVIVHHDVAETVDGVLSGMPVSAEERVRREDGEVQTHRMQTPPLRADLPERSRHRTPEPGLTHGWSGRTPVGHSVSSDHALQMSEVNHQHTPGADSIIRPLRVFPFGVSSSKLDDAARALQLPLVVLRDMADAQVVLTLRSYFRRFPETLQEAEARGIPVNVLRSNTQQQIHQALVSLFHLSADPEDYALRETEDAIAHVLGTGESVQLEPASAGTRRLQHAMAERYNLVSRSWGREPNRSVRIFREGKR